MQPIQIILKNVVCLENKIPSSVLYKILQTASHRDPVWAYQKKKGYNVNPLDEYIYSYKYSKDQSKIYFARGLFEFICKTLTTYRIPFEISDQRVTHPSLDVSLNPNISLFKYQERAISQLLTNPQGILDASCGSGKTVMALSCVARLKQPTLVIVNTLELLKQWKREAEKILEGQKIGQISGVEKTIKNITISTFQSLLNFEEQELKDFLARFGCILFDECHHNASSGLSKICNFSPSKYRYGFTATPIRKDRREFIMMDSLGPHLSKVDEKELEEEGRLVSSDVEFVILKDQVKFSYINIRDQDGYVSGQDLNWGRIFSNLAQASQRTDVIVDKIIEKANDGHNILVLSPRVGHCQEIFKLLKNKTSFSISLLIGETDKKTRDKIIKLARAGEISIIIATNNMAAEALDIPALSCVHITMPTTNPHFLKQAAGRIRRVLEGKKTPLVVDYVDQNNSVLYGMAKSRERSYKSLGFTILNPL